MTDSRQPASAGDPSSWHWEEPAGSPAKYDNRRYLVATFPSWAEQLNRDVERGPGVEAQPVPMACAEGYITST